MTWTKPSNSFSLGISLKFKGLSVEKGEITEMEEE